MAGSRPRVFLGLLSAQQEFQKLQARDARAAAEVAGFDLEVVYAEDAAVIQIQQLYKAIHRPAEERPVAIVVETVVGEGLERVARAATGAGIGWILINRNVPYLDALRAQYPALPIAVVSTDQVEVGRIQARQLRALVAATEGEILYLQGPSDTSVAQERLRGTQEGLKGTALELRLLDGRWTEESGEHAVKRWRALKTSGGERAVAVASQNDAMAVGAARALSASALARLPITGCDGLPDGGVRLVDEGKLAATVVTPPNTGPAVRLLAQVLNTRLPAPRSVIMQPESYPSEASLRLRARPAGGRTP
jgi:ABC-type sugar transport system substrate-binding protein